MKQILFTVISFIATMSVYAAGNGVIATFTTERLGLALDADGTTYPVYYQVEGSDLVFYFLNEDFTKGNKVVFKGYGYIIDRDSPNYDGHSEIYGFNLDYTVLYDSGNNILLTRGIFERKNTTDWMMEIHKYPSSGGKAISLVSSSGKVISYSKDGDYWFDGFGLIPMGNKLYGAECWYYQNSILKVVDYSDGISSVKAVFVNGSQAYPNPLPAGETLTVEFESPTDSAGRFMVIDMRGRTVYSVPVEAGTTEVYVPAGLVRHGEYIYTVTDGHNLIANGKVLAY